MREAGLPQVAITPAYLRAATENLLHEHVLRQRDYHSDKARRLAGVHHNLDRSSEILFALAVVSVTGYLALKGGECCICGRCLVREGFLFLPSSVLCRLSAGRWPASGISAIRAVRGDFQRHG